MNITRDGQGQTIYWDEKKGWTLYKADLQPAYPLCGSEENPVQEITQPFVVFKYGEEGMVQLSNNITDLEEARSFCDAWKPTRTFIFQFVENGAVAGREK